MSRVTDADVRAAQALAAGMTADDVRDVRFRLGMTQPELAALFGVTVRAVQLWEQGTRSVPPLARVCMAVMDAERDDGRQRLRRILERNALGTV